MAVFGSGTRWMKIRGPSAVGVAQGVGVVPGLLRDPRFAEPLLPVGKPFWWLVLLVTQRLRPEPAKRPWVCRVESHLETDRHLNLPMTSTSGTMLA